MSSKWSSVMVKCHKAGQQAIIIHICTLWLKNQPCPECCLLADGVAVRVPVVNLVELNS